MKPRMKPLSLCLLVLLLSACAEDAPPPAPVVIQVPSEPATPAATPVAVVEPARRDVAAEVKKALEAASREIAQGVDVTESGGAVRLFGTVGSEAERLQAARIAQGLAGVTSVENRIVVVKGS